LRSHNWKACRTCHFLEDKLHLTCCLTHLSFSPPWLLCLVKHDPLKLYGAIPISQRNLAWNKKNNNRPELPETSWFIGEFSHIWHSTARMKTSPGHCITRVTGVHRWGCPVHPEFIPHRVYKIMRIVADQVLKTQVCQWIVRSFQSKSRPYDRATSIKVITQLSGIPSSTSMTI
jgi:hypothetical protein